MADSQDPDSSENEANSFKEELSHVEELLISSREECIDIGLKYKELSEKMENILKLHDDNSPDSSSESDMTEFQKEFKNELEEQFLKYQNRISMYQHTQTEQAKIVDDLQSRVEEYRIRCAKLEAALAEHSAHEASFTDENITNDNVYSMDLETALIRLEQEKNRCQGLTQINNLLREQLETATNVNQTLTTDVRRLTKEWQHARSQLLAKESEWKEEEQTFSIFFTKESNILLALWRQILNFRHDFSRLKNSTEKDLSSFKVCICHTTQNVTEAIIQAMDISNLQNVDLNFNVEQREIPGSDLDSSFERAKLQERIHDLIDRNDKIQQLLDEKERVNTTLCDAIENMNNNLKNSVNKVISEVKAQHSEKLLTGYFSAIKEINELLTDDANCMILSNLTHPSLPLDMENIPDGETHLHNTVKAVRSALQKYHLQVEELNLKVASLEEQNSMNQRAVEFLDDDKQKLHELNIQLSSQLESLHQKMQDYLQDTRQAEDAFEQEKHKQCLDTMLKSLNDQIESLTADRNRLLKIQEDLQTKVQALNEEKSSLRMSKENLTMEVNKSSKQVEVLEKNLENLRRDYQQCQEKLYQATIDKELLEEEKLKFSTVLSNLEKQSFELKNCMEKLRDEENIVKDSLLSLQNLCESLSQEKTDLSKSLNDASEEVKSLKMKSSEERIAFEKEKLDLKEQISKLQEQCKELEIEQESAQNRLKQLESFKLELEEEKNQLSLTNNDLTNQVTKCLTQKNNIEAELERAKEELNRHLAKTEDSSQENDALNRMKAELSVKYETTEGELLQLEEVVAALREEKDNLEMALYGAHKIVNELQEEKSDLARDVESQKSTVGSLQLQIKELKEHYEKESENYARQKHALILKMQQIEHEFQITLRNERQQHNVDLDILTEEKETLRSRLISALDDLFEQHQKEHDELITNHQEEIANLKKHILLLEKECDEKSLLLQTEKKKLEMRYQSKISSLDKQIRKQQKLVSDYESKASSFDENSTATAKQQKKLEDLKSNEKKLKDEMDSMILEHTKVVKELENKVKDLKEQKESALDKVSQFESELKDCQWEKNRLSKELDEIITGLKTEKTSKLQVESRASLLENQLKDEKTITEVVKKSLDECKDRLKTAETENLELKRLIDEREQELNAMEKAASKEKSQNVDLRNALREVEKARQECKRELQSLKRRISVLENTLQSKERELTELHILHGREEEKESEHRREIMMLKQKVMESHAAKETALKEALNFKRKLSDLEHKLKLQEEQHQSVLQECLSSEQNLSEHRLTLERSMADAGVEMQNLRSKLNYEEGKVLALESKVMKLEALKKEVEGKLYTMCLFLRSILGLGTDSGFLGSSSSVGVNSWHLQRGSPARHNTSVSSSKDSPSRFNLLRSGSPAQFTVSDLDIDLLKSSLQDLVQKFHISEKEKDDLKADKVDMQQRVEEIEEERNRFIQKVYQLKSELEDKKNVEKDLATKIASIHHYEEVCQTLEREKRRLTEKIGILEYDLVNSEKEKQNLLNKIAEMKKLELQLEEEKQALVTSHETVKTKVLKSDMVYRSLEAEVLQLRETVAHKEAELKSLEQNMDVISKRLHSSENRNKSLQVTIDDQNASLEKHMDNENLLKQKLNNVNKTLSQNSSIQLSVQEDLEKIRKEHVRCEKEISRLQQMCENLRSNADEYKFKNKILNDEVQSLQSNLKQGEVIQQELHEQVAKLQTIALKFQDLENETSHRIRNLEQHKQLLEKQVLNVSASLKDAREMCEEKEICCQKFGQERNELKKSLEKLEKEKLKNGELTTKSLMEKHSLGRTLSKMDMENKELQRKVQDLQAQLAELEERHSQRLKDFLTSQTLEAKLEEERLRIALKRQEQISQAREKTHKQKIMGLEEQISVLKDQLEQEKLRWQQYYQRAFSAGSDIRYLNSVLSQSLQNVTEDPQRLLPEAERLNLTTDAELATTPGISLSTPSKLRRSSSAIRTSTPKTKKNHNFS